MVKKNKKKSPCFICKKPVTKLITVEAGVIRDICKECFSKNKDQVKRVERDG